MESTARTCPHCHTNNSFVLGEPLVCKKCGQAFAEESTPGEQRVPTGCKKQTTVCLVLLAIPVAIIILIMIFGDKNAGKSIEQIQREQRSRQLQEETQRIEDAKRRGVDRALEEIERR